MSDKNINKNLPVFMAVNKADYALPVVKENKASGGYLTYGEENDYPNYLLNLFANSALHAAIVSGKVDYVIGNGLASESGNTKIQAFIEKCNSKGDSLNDVFRKCCYDYMIFGGFALQVVYQKLGGKIAEVYYVDMAKLRHNINCDKLKYSKDWGVKNRVKVLEYDRYDENDPTGTKIYYYNGEATRDQYPVPAYIASIAAIETDIEISNFHLNGIKNGMFPSIMINFKNGQPDTEEAEIALERKINAKLGGTSKTGKMLMTFSDSGTDAPSITPIQQPDLDKRFIILQDSIRDKIFIGHRIAAPILFGITSTGKLGNTEEYNQGYQIFEKAYIKPTQKILLRIFNRILSVNFKDADLVVLQTPPLDTNLKDETIITNNMTQVEVRTRLKKEGFIEEIELPEGVQTLGEINNNAKINSFKTAA